jgi:hypothetical protein
MKNQDEIDTNPIVMKDSTKVEFESIDLAPGERAEIILAPKRPLRCPVLFMSSTVKNNQVVVEEVTHSRVPILVSRDQQLDSFRFGQKIDLLITESEPVKIVLVNNGTTRTLVGASLIANEQEQDTTYRLKGDEIKNKE